jgi:protein-L-isoaspartate(D-aspartate) O-methyltransferase
MMLAATGIGLTSDRTRQRLIDRLREQGITDEVVLTAMSKVQRHTFVEPALASRGYEETALPIGFGQTLSHPFSVARFVSIARGGRTLRAVLDVGAGCGYQTAVLAQLAHEVLAIERIGGLAALARRNLRQAGVVNAQVKLADGWAMTAPVNAFDAILLAAAAPEIPYNLTELLVEGGRMVLPAARLPQFATAIDQVGEQYLTVIDKQAGQLQIQQLEPVYFVPLLRELA